MRFTWGVGVVLLVVAGCQSKGELYPPPPPCTGSNCYNNPAGGSTPGKDGGPGGGGGGGAGGGAGAIDQSGTVHRITSPSFADTALGPFTGVATIVAYPEAGGMLTTPYGGSAGTTFTFNGIPGGPTWFYVKDESSGGSQILSTLWYAKLPVAGDFALPVIDLGMMDAIASNLPTVAAKGGVLPGSAQVVLLVSHQNQPYKGVSVTGGTGGAQIAYDSGTSYSDMAAATGVGGTVILFNAGLSGLSTITLTDTSTMMAYGVEVQAAPGGATLAGIDIP